MAHVSVEERRPQLVSAAIALMKREGAHAASTRAVAAELGVAQATVHYVFGSREEMYRAVIMKLTDDLVAYVQAVDVPEFPDFEQCLAVLVNRLWQSLLDDPYAHLLLTELSVLALRSPTLKALVEDHRMVVDHVTGSLIRTTAGRAGVELLNDPIWVAQFFLAGFDGMTQQHLAAPHPEAERWRVESLISATTVLAIGTPLQRSVPSVRVADPLT